jgi:cation transport protein ChaC
MNQWLFGYGSLIWRPDFDYLRRRPARLHGWSRRFWQGSHDHRGLPDAPGRVVTLVRDPDGFCDGMGYLVDAAVIEDTFATLDHREKNGYERHPVRLAFDDPGAEEDAAADGVVYIAPEGNFAYLGPAPLPDIARQIHRSQGPSGRNIDYLLDLARALRDQGARDDHVFALETAVRELHP